MSDLHQPFTQAAERGAGPTAGDDIAADDIVLPFQIDPFGLRGRLVRLGPALDLILKRHAYPRPVATALAETVAIAAGLAGALKYEGVFTLQIQGDGPVRLMVADVTSDGRIRGYAQFDAARVAALGPSYPSVPKLFGAGFLAFSVDQGVHTDRYQGIVELTGATLAECAHQYFRQSEQFEAAIKVAAEARQESGGAVHWRAGAIMIQRLPQAGAAGAVGEDAEEGWRRALILMSSATPAELVESGLAPWRLIDRLFLAEGVRIYRPHDLRHACRCSRQRVAEVLSALPRADLDHLRAEGEAVVTCEFCNRRHVFDRFQLDELRLAEEPA